MLRPVLDLLVPPACVVCRAPGLTPLCGACRRTLRFLKPGEVCARCGLPPPCGRRGEDRTTSACPAAGALWRAAWAPVAYVGPAIGLVAALKFRGALPCAQAMAAHVVAGAPLGLLRDGAVIVPVPTHPARARRRGYDQARVLARALAGRTGGELRSCLRRTGAGTRQLGAGREERLRSGRVELRCHGPAPRHAILIDDVHTTGATLRAAAQALCAGGAQDIVAITWARTL